MSQSQAEQTTYKIPHPAIYELANAQLAPALKMDAIGQYALLMHRNIYKSITELSLDEIKLAGIRTNTLNNISPREQYYHKLTLLEVDSTTEYEFNGLPDNGKFCKITWNCNFSKLSALNILEESLQLWILDVYNKTATLCYEGKINANLGNPVTWLKDDGLLVNVVPATVANYKVKKNSVPTGPVVAENAGKAVENRTFQDLLKDEIDEHNFEVLATSEIWHFDRDYNHTIWKPAALHDGLSLSPDGTFILLSEIKRPFSYFVPFDRFPYSTYVYHIDGTLVKTIVESPLIEYLPQGFMAVQKGMRQISWRTDLPHTLVWAEALDEGNPEIPVAHRDAIYQQTFPFVEAPRLLFKTIDRFAGIYFANENLALIYDRWWTTRNQRTILFNPNDPEDYSLVDERNFQDIYTDPGTFVTAKNQYGLSAIQVLEDGTMFLTGDGHSAEGRKPFVDKYNHKTKEKNRIFTANEEGKQEDIVYLLNVVEGTIITVIQSKNEYPNFYKRNIYTGEKKLIRHFENPFKAIQDVKKEIISYKRHDGVELNATLYMPVGYDMTTTEKLPMIVWAYPTEYKDKDTAGQKTAADNDFIYPFWGSPLYWVNRGYIVLDNAAFPILGEGDTQPNDTFVDQLVANAKAAIDAVDDRGFLDRQKVAVGGHSYGAFMVSMLLTNTDFFAAGIARSGAYNRTLTPFGFQREERNYWQAKSTYDAMNPFINADKMKTPLLLIHGDADNNTGTHTMQTERYFAALNALGANVRMVLLPKESHSYAAWESVMHVLWEQDEWLDKWVKNKATQPIQ
jgi:dipeptidyl aminopeptidase/acylaminoacyl peptidase